MHEGGPEGRTSSSPSRSRCARRSPRQDFWDRQLFTRGWYNGYEHTMITQKTKFSRTPSSSPSTWSIPCPPSPSTTRIAGKTSIAARSNRDRSGTTRPTELDAVQVRPPFSHASDPSSALWCRAFGGAGGADITVSPAKGPISARKIKTTSRTSRSKPSRQAQTPTTPAAFQRSRIVRLPP